MKSEEKVVGPSDSRKTEQMPSPAVATSKKKLAVKAALVANDEFDEQDFAGVASAPQSRYTCVTNTGPGLDDMTMVIDQMAAEINETENRLRHFLIERIEAGNANEAAEMLRDWSAMAAGDVLNKYTKNGNAQS